MVELHVRLSVGGEHRIVVLRVTHWNAHSAAAIRFQRRTRLARAYSPAVGFEDVGPQWDSDEPWQTQQARITVRGLTDDSPWMRHQRRVFFVALAGLVTVIALLIAISLAFA